MNDLDVKGRAHRLAAEMRALPDLTLELDGCAAFAVLSQLQLAFRHPDNHGSARRLAEGVAREIEAALAAAGPEAARVCAAGWPADEDVPGKGDRHG